MKPVHCLLKSLYLSCISIMDSISTNASFIRRNKTKDKRKTNERRRGDPSPRQGLAGWLAQPGSAGNLSGRGRGKTRRHATALPVRARARYFPAGLASSRHSRDRAAGQAFPVGVSSSSLLDTSHEGEELAGASVRAAGCCGRAGALVGRGKAGTLARLAGPGGRSVPWAPPALRLGARSPRSPPPLVSDGVAWRLAGWDGSISVSTWM